jgi:FHS family L-fucose permease-like MFS transporter
MNRQSGPFAAMGVLFFMIGFITVLNDILVPHMKSLFDLNYTQAALIQFSFFTAYFVIAFPSSWLISRLGYQRSIVTGLVISAFGTCMFYPASILQSYPMFLGGLFTLASGFALLQTALNPYVAVLGPPEGSSARLALAQALNSVGTTLAPLLGAMVILGGHMLSPDAVASLESGARDAYRASQSESVQLPYALLTAMLAALAVGVAYLKLPIIAAVEGDDERRVSFLAPLRLPHLRRGVIGIFAYVGAEVAIGSFMVSYLHERTGMTEATGATYVALYWGGAMVGRFIGAYLLTRVNPSNLLGMMAVVNVILTASSTVLSGMTAAYALIACGLFNSIMFSTMFTLSIKDLGAMTNKGSSWLIAAILGGAIIPAMQGAIADMSGSLVWSYLLPTTCYIYIAYYGFRGSQHATM